MDIATLIFIGVIVSLLITFLKKFVFKNAGVTGSMLIVVLVSLMGAGIYTTLIHFGYWDAFLRIIAIAGAFYAYIIKNIKDLDIDSKNG